MKNFRASNTAVKLGLIITMMIQPLVSASVATGCGARLCSQTPSCLGCGCCQVAEANADRCCCGMPEEVPSESDDAPHDVPDSEAVGIDNSLRSLSGLCLCGLVFPPMDRGDVRGSERNDVCKPECQAAVLLLKTQQLSPNLIRTVSFSESIPDPRCAQRQFCVWRI